MTARVAFAAAHVVADPTADNTPGAAAVLDWDATLAYRHYLWDLGFGVADAMDTAQRGMGLDWPAARDLIVRSGAEARTRKDARLACGVNTDHVAAGCETLADVAAAYLEQLEVVQTAGARPIIMASRALAAMATRRDDYHEVYGRVLREADQPVILHWLGTAFDPRLAGYWAPEQPGDLDAATDAVVDLIVEHREVVDGIKVSLLDADREVRIRRRLPAGVRLYTGDDFNFPALIRGDSQGHSDALLGVFDAIAPVAARALRALGGGDYGDVGDEDDFTAILEPTVPLARHLFAAPTYHYKTGIVFLAWLAGHQTHFTMLNGAQAARPPKHLLELARLAAELNLFPDPDLAEQRLRAFRTTIGAA